MMMKIKMRMSPSDGGQTKGEKIRVFLSAAR